MGSGERDRFVARYGGVYEHSPWVAEDAFDADGASSGEELVRSLAAAVDRATLERRLGLIRAHPDLAGKAAVAGELTAESTDEQRSAGIDRCSPEEFERFQRLNAEYRGKFDFPFVIAVRGRGREDILEAFAERLKNDRQTEFDAAIAEIHQIARLRLQVMEGAQDE